MSQMARGRFPRQSGLRRNAMDQADHEDGQGGAEATRAGFYSNTGTITISMASVKPEWLDDTGVWTK